MKFGLTEETVKRIAGVFSNYPQIKEVKLLGSRAKGNYRNGSDIDLTLLGDHLNQSDIGRIANSLDELMLPYSFDISIYKQLTNEDFIDHIDRIGVTFYKKE